ncbi:MAG: ion transporter [Alphaproteobacteria bacterium]|nr:ion transporter [Alphaproteobacteria bacterium]
MVAQQVAVQAGLRYKLYLEMEPHARSKPGLSSTNTFIVALVLFSFLLFALETEPTITGSARQWIVILNYAVLVAFAVEYIVRLWVVGLDGRHGGMMGRLRYALSIYALADLAAFLPELLWLSLPHTGDDERMLMFLRVLRLVRLLKIARFSPAFDILGAAFKRASSQLLTALALAMALVFVSAVTLYFIEGVGQGRQQFASIPRAIWWAVATLTTVGYGDVYPVTVWGKVAAALIAFAGIGVVALPTGIFASAFSAELRHRERLRHQHDEAQEIARDVVEEIESSPDIVVTRREAKGPEEPPLL